MTTEYLLDLPIRSDYPTVTVAIVMVAMVTIGCNGYYPVVMLTFNHIVAMVTDPLNSFYH